MRSDSQNPIIHRHHRMQLGEGGRQQHQDEQEIGTHGAMGGPHWQGVWGADHRTSAMAHARPHGLAALPTSATNASSNEVESLLVAEGGIETAASSGVASNAWSKPPDLGVIVAIGDERSSGDGLAELGVVPQVDAVGDDTSLGWEPENDQKEGVKPMRRHGRGWFRGNSSKGRRAGRDAKEQTGARNRKNGGGARGGGT